MGVKSFPNATILALRVSEQRQNNNTYEKTPIHRSHQLTSKQSI
jgi:hypothetical protein